MQVILIVFPLARLFIIVALLCSIIRLSRRYRLYRNETGCETNGTLLNWLETGTTAFKLGMTQVHALAFHAV